MQITFDPHNVQECATIARLLGTTAQPETEQPDTAQSVEAAVAEVMLADTAPAQPETVQPETDCHGMTHDGAIHSTPPSFNADGSYRAKRGHKEAYDAAVAAATAPAPEPAPQGMPMPQPASAVAGTPPAPVDYKTMAERFMAKMADPDGLPAEYEAIYAALSIGYDDLETNQTSIARLSSYMDAVDNGDDHDGCVRHAMSADQ